MSAVLANGEIKPQRQDWLAVDLAFLDIGDQPFQGWPLHCAAGKPAIIIERRQHRPALVLLRENEGGAGFPLGVKRVEGLLQPFLR